MFFLSNGSRFSDQTLMWVVVAANAA